MPGATVLSCQVAKLVESLTDAEYQLTSGSLLPALYTLRDAKRECGDIIEAVVQSAYNGGASKADIARALHTAPSNLRELKKS